MEERIASAKACRYVDCVIPEAPITLSKQFIIDKNIDIVAHGDDFDEAKMNKYYKVPIDMGIMKVLTYTNGVSTTNLINRIKQHIKEGIL